LRPADELNHTGNVTPAHPRGTAAWAQTVLALAAIIALAVIRISRQDVSGADPATERAGDVTSPSRA
jgi:hypothetical protein